VHHDQPGSLLGDERIGADNALLQLREHAILTRVVGGMGPRGLHHPGGHLELPADYGFHTRLGAIVTLSTAKGAIST